MRWTWFFAFFLVSGFSSLVYEVVWLRLAMASFGVTTPLVSLVVSVFLAGLALGSWLAGRLASTLSRRRLSASVRLYAGTELVIAASGMAVPYLFESGRQVLEWAAGHRPWGSAEYHLVSGSVVAATLLPFCTAMGATTPLAMAALRRSAASGAERAFSHLYLANVIGATAGTLTAAFVLVEVLGFRRTLHVAASLNVLVAGLAFALSFASEATPAPAKAGVASAERSQGRVGRSVLGLLFLTGGVSLAMEIVWVRQLTAYLGTVVYAFATILALYLSATSVGSMIYRARARRRPVEGTPPVSTWALVGLLGFVPLAGADPRLPLPDGLPPGLLRAALGIVPISGTLGYLTPMLVDGWSRGEPARAGSAYAVNVLAGILGALVAGFALVPFLGERGAIVALATPFFVVAGLAARRASGRAGVRSRALVAAALVLAGATVLLTRSFESLFHPRVVRRDATATVIASGEGRTRRLLINGRATTVLTPITKMMAHLPAAFRPRAPRDALVICFGMGTSFRSLLSWGVSVTAVEVVPSVPSLFGYYHEDAGALLRSPRANVVVDDGRRFLERSRGRYDIITVDPPPPVQAAGSSLLYSREFYLTAQKRLAPEGIVHQWLPPEGDATVVTAVARALRAVFPHVRVFGSVQGWGYHLLASAEPLPDVSARELAGRLPARAVTDLLEWGPAATAEEQFALVLSRELSLAAVGSLDREAPILEDDLPVNEYYVVRKALRALRS